MTCYIYIENHPATFSSLVPGRNIDAASIVYVDTSVQVPGVFEGS